MRRLLFLAPLLALCGCANGTPPIAPQSEAVSATSPAAEVELTPIKVAAFEQEIRAKYKGKVVAADVWYLGCGPCLKAMPETVALASEYAGKGAVVMTVDRMPDDLGQKEKVVTFLQSVDAKVPNYIFDDTEDAVYEWTERAGFRPSPAMVFFGKDGKLVKSLVAPKKDEVARELDRLLAQ